MHKFMIGMHGKYDHEKFRRDFREDFYGVEVCLFEYEHDILDLIKESSTKNFKYGIHFPLRSGLSKLRDPQFLSLNEHTRVASYEIIEQELIYIKDNQINPEYILFHFPKPVILKSDFDMKNWRFAHNSEYVYEADYSYEKFKKYSEDLFKWVSEKSIEYNFTPVFELDALNKYICSECFLETLLEKYKRVKICLDTGRLHLQNKIDPNFDDIGIIKRFAKYAEIIHLWNVKINTNLQNSHYPVLPNLDGKDGWAPIEKYLQIIKKETTNVKFLFEHRSDLISDEELDRCYSWVKNILS